MPAVVSSIHLPDSTAPSSAAAGATFDIAGLKRRCLDDEALAGMLLERFISRLSDGLSQIERLLSAGDWTAAASKAHALKGEAGSLAAVKLFAVATDLEQCLRSDRAGDSPSLFDRLRSEAQQCLNEAPAILAQLSAVSASH